MVLCLAKQDDIVYIYREDYHRNAFDFKSEGLQFAIIKLLSSNYFELYDFEMNWIQNVQWNYTIGREAVGGWRRMVSE